MKKNSFLILFPVFAFTMELMPTAVSVFLEEGTQTCSFFGTLPDGSLPLGLSVAGMLTVVAAAVAIVYAVTKKTPWLTALIWISLGAATCAVLPILARTEPVVLPNVGVALLLLLESLVAFWRKKEAAKESSKQIIGK